MSFPPYDTSSLPVFLSLSGKVCLLEVQDDSSADIPACCYKNKKLLFYDCCAQDGFQPFILSISPSLITNSRSWGELFLVGFFTSCDMKLLSTHLKKILDIFLSVVMYCQHTSGGVFLQKLFLASYPLI